MLLTLTDKATGNSFELEEKTIQRAYLDQQSPNTGTTITYGNSIINGFNQQITVTQSPATVASLSEVLKPLTDYDSGNTVYFNTDGLHFVNVRSDGSTGSYFYYFWNGSTAGQYHVTESPAVVKLLNEESDEEDKTPIAITKSALATLTGAEVGAGRLETSAGPYTITLPTASDLATALGATAGTTFPWIVNNAAGGTITIVLNTGITTGTTWSATITASNAGQFRFLFRSATDCVIARVI